MPTRKEAEEYKRILERNMVRIAESDLPDNIKDDMLNEALDKYQTNMRNLNDCITHPVHKKIAEVYDKAVTPVELEAAKRYQHEVQDAMTPEEKKEYNEAMITDFRRMMAAKDEDIADLRAEALRKKMGDMLKFINLSQIARDYFGKSQSWLMQRINGNTVNGKEARFTPAEVKQLEAAFHDLGHKFLALTF